MLLIVGSLASETPILGHMAGILNASGWLYHKVWNVLCAIAPPGYQWSPVIGGSGDIGILNANCAMLFLIILAALGYCVILDANHYSKLLSDCSYPQDTIPYHTIALVHQIPNCSGFQIGVREGARCL
jgi:hypothetical protein